ncbi:hypothetical protein MKX08_004485 [Trichoderma sp. CBMAI-0020]|nr:hypothetical protein MKX08_004485 [Trichoderma sp. CBMAI-0020]
MAKKKVKQAVGEDEGGIGSRPSVPVPAAHQAQSSPSPNSRHKSRTPDAAHSTAAPTGLAICRNKHWRYISSYHGPWLQMPYEILETIANINYNTPLPRPLDAASFFDLVKARRLVDEATNLAVRAASDIASPTLTSVNGGFPGISSMISHGMGTPGHGGRLSRERKFKMREQASQKLARAYRLDEIVCSVATMQGASPLEDVGNLVLQRNPRDPDAKYVHFFHEKIPSRKMAESTSLEPLTEIIGDRPGEPEVLRTRATVKVFQNDLEGAVFDLTHALSISQFIRKSHQPKQEDTQIVDSQRTAARRRPHDVILPEKDQPSSLEAQLYFQRASVYLTLASDNAVDSMPAPPSNQSNENLAITDERDEEAKAEASDPGKEISRKQVESRKMAKTYAKRAIKDYLSFFSNIHYSPNLPAKIAKEFNDRVSMVMHGIRSSRALDTSSWTTSHTVYSLPDLFRSVPPADLPPYPAQDLMKQGVQQPLDETACEWVTYHPLLSDALHSLLLAHCLAQTSTKEIQRHAYMVARLIRLSDGYPLFQANRSSARADWTELVHCAGNWLQLSSSWDNLCQPAPLPAYLEDPCKHHCAKHGGSHKKAHPHSERSIAASAAAALVGGGTFDATTAAAEEEQRRKELIREQAIADTLDDERVTDETSFRAAVRAREKRAQQNEALFSTKMPNGTFIAIHPGPGLSMNGSNETNEANGAGDVKETETTNGINGTNGARGTSGSNGARNGYRAIKETDLEPVPSQSWSAEDGKEYSLTTERANAIARWVQEAPVVTGMTKRKKRTKKTDGSTNSPSAKIDEAETGLQKLEI